MAQLVDELLEISRVTGGKIRLQKEPVDVATIVAFAVETSRPGIEAASSSPVDHFALRALSLSRLTRSAWPRSFPTC